MQTDNGPRLDPAVRNQIAVFRQSLRHKNLKARHADSSEFAFDRVIPRSHSVLRITKWRIGTPAPAFSLVCGCRILSETDTTTNVETNCA